MATRKITCYHCKRKGPQSANNHAYCESCEQRIREAYKNKHLCPKCGSAGESRGTSHWSGVDGSGGFVEHAFCPTCRETYAIPDNPVIPPGDTDTSRTDGRGRSKVVAIVALVLVALGTAVALLVIR